MEYKSFKELQIWQMSEILVENVYKQTELFPKSEKFNLVSQLRRSSVSIAGNIAESWGRYHYADKIRVLYIARGEIEELRAYLSISKKLNFIDPLQYIKLENFCEKLITDLNKYKKSLASKINN